MVFVAKGVSATRWVRSKKGVALVIMSFLPTGYAAPFHDFVDVKNPGKQRSGHGFHTNKQHLEDNEGPDACEVKVNIDCIVKAIGTNNDQLYPDSTKCEDLLYPLLDRCDDRPNDMLMKFNGGNCGQSLNLQPQATGTSWENYDWQCVDHQASDGMYGPPSEGFAYIVATDARNEDIVYFSGSVEVGTTFNLNRNNEDVAEDMNITISEGTTPGGEILQTIKIHSACPCPTDGTPNSECWSGDNLWETYLGKKLFLSDKFGSVQLVGYTNNGQGTVSTFVNVTYMYTLENQGTVDAYLVELVSERSPPFPSEASNLTEEMVNQSPLIGYISPNEIFVVEEDEQIDMSVRKNYTTTVTLSAKTAQGNPCSDTKLLSFEAGYSWTPPPRNTPRGSRGRGGNRYLRTSRAFG